KSLHPQIDEVRSGGGYFSQNDLRVHFGIGKAENVELLEIRWPSGLVETLKDVKPNQVIFVKEGEGIVRTQQFDPPKPPNHQSETFLSCSGGSSDSFFFSFSLFIFPFLSVLSVSSALILVRNLFPLLDFTLPCIFFSCDH